VSARIAGSAFQEFSWLQGDLRRDHAAIFAAQMKDLGFGVQKCLQLIEASELDSSHGAEDDDDDNAPLLNAYDTSVLLRFAMTAAGIIGAQAEVFLDRAHAAASPAGEGCCHE
jgi:hypothetical protein